MVGVSGLVQMMQMCWNPSTTFIVVLVQRRPLDKATTSAMFKAVIVQELLSRADHGLLWQNTMVLW